MPALGGDYHPLLFFFATFFYEDRWVLGCSGSERWGGIVVIKRDVKDPVCLHSFFSARLVKV